MYLDLSPRALTDVLCFRCPKIPSAPLLCSGEEGGRKAPVDFICLLPVSSAAKNEEPRVKNKSQHLSIPNYQGGTHFCCHSKAGNKHKDTINLVDRTPTDKPPGSPKAKAALLQSSENSS